MNSPADTHLLPNRMHQYNQSLAYDKRMYAADVKGSIAFSKALQKAGIVSSNEQAEIERGLRLVEEEWKNGKVCRLDLDCWLLGNIADRATLHIDSSTSKPMTRISIRRTSVDCRKSSAKTLAASFTLVVAGMIKLRPT